MDRDTFVSTRRARWDALTKWVERPPADAAGWTELARLYRGVCTDLASARSMGQPDDVCSYLDELAGRAHNLMYGARRVSGLGIISLIASEFPRELRKQWAFFLLANVLFYGPFIVGAVGAYLDPGFAASVMSEAGMAQLEDMYASPNLARGGGEDATMAGFYVFNNIGIAFRCFVTGALVGLGPMYVLVFNGLSIGTAFGHLGSAGLLPNLLAFTAGHSAWELTGIVVSGTAGMRMGWSMVVTEGRTRAASMRAAGPGLFRLVVGTFVLLAMAALIEGFWSAGPMPPLGKYIFGLLQIGIVTAWLAFGGRGQS